MSTILQVSFLYRRGYRLCTWTVCVWIDIVEYLLEKTSSGDSKVELGNNEGRTLLHVAALTDNRPLVAYLLDNHQASKSSVWTHKVTYSLGFSSCQMLDY